MYLEVVIYVHNTINIMLPDKYVTFCTVGEINLFLETSIWHGKYHLKYFSQIRLLQHPKYNYIGL